MDCIDKLQALSVRLSEHQDHALENVSVRNALVLSFIDALGYNVFDRDEVVPRFRDHDGVGDGECIDYAILHNGHPVVLFDCRGYGSDLGNGSAGFRRHFAAIQPVVGVVTDGVEYRFHSDVKRVKRMDDRPFLEIDLRDVASAPVAEIEALSRRRFDPDSVWEMAGNLLYTQEVYQVLSDQMIRPADDFVRFFACRMCPPVFTRRDRERFAGVVRQALRGFVKDGGVERLSAHRSNGSPRAAELKQGPRARRARGSSLEVRNA